MIDTPKALTCGGKIRSRAREKIPTGLFVTSLVEVFGIAVFRREPGLPR